MSRQDVAVPAGVAAAAGGRDLTLVWVNDAGGLTFTFSAGTQRCFVKWAPAGSGLDLGLLGVADPWADLAVATWSAEWNYGPGWDNLLYDAYGVRPDADRIGYYRLLYDLSS